MYVPCDWLSNKATAKTCRLDFLEDWTWWLLLYSKRHSKCWTLSSILLSGLIGVVHLVWCLRESHRQPKRQLCMGRGLMRVLKNMSEFVCVCVVCVCLGRAVGEVFYEGLGLSCNPFALVGNDPSAVWRKQYDNENTHTHARICIVLALTLLTVNVFTSSWANACSTIWLMYRNRRLVLFAD